MALVHGNNTNSVIAMANSTLPIRFSNVMSLVEYLVVHYYPLIRHDECVRAIDAQSPHFL